MIEFSRSTNYQCSKVLYVLHYPLPYLKALRRKCKSKIFQSNNQCNLPSKHLPADCFFKMVPPRKSLSARQFNYKSVYQKTSQSLYRYRASRRGKGKTNQERLNPKAETKYNENNYKKGLPRFSLLLKFVYCRNLVGYQKHFFTAETVSAKTTGPTTASTTKKKRERKAGVLTARYSWMVTQPVCYSRKWTWHCSFNFQMWHFSDA